MALTALSQRVVERAAASLGQPRARSMGRRRGVTPLPDAPGGNDRTGVTRRSFLARSAVVGSALAVAPARFLLQPGTAYAAITDVCGPDADCGPGGFTVFCCTINGGVNQCPPGSFPGGWWRAGTGSSWCCGGDRYYIDCQASCPPGCSCDNGHFCPGCQACTSGCNNGPTCDQRNVCNVRFRYGQCNEQIGCSGNVLCRTVSCTPPWQIPGLNCAFGPDKTDPATAEHSAPCLQQASWSGGAFPISPDLVVASPAVAQLLGSARQDLFARGVDGRVHWTTNQGNGWGGSRSLGAPPVGFKSSPAAVSGSPDDVNLFVWGGDNQLWQRATNDGGRSWTGWAKPLGNDLALASAPAVCSWGPGRVDIFAIGTDGAVHHRWFDGGWNAGWELLGSPPAALQFSALGVAAWAPGRLDLFATAASTLWQLPFDGQWHQWTQPAASPGTTLASAPAATSWGPNHLGVFARGADNALHWTTFFQGYWSGWQRVGNRSDVFTGNPAAVAPGCQQLRVFGRGPAGHVREYVYSG